MRTQAWCNDKGYDTTIHPIVKSVLFLEDLLAEMVAKNSKDPFGNIRVARKALSKIRCVSPTASQHFSVCHMLTLWQIWFAEDKCCPVCCRELQRGVPPPYGEAFSKETLIRAASSKAFAATTEARIGLQATSCSSVSKAMLTVGYYCCRAREPMQPITW